ncbi:zinc protease [Candidatus Xenohaliotis californiensis]|uniref:Zinc protease n=1 Tax=Candidatus Xenohaliotis californiensis TaxID=84677 RepID=A0ABM9N9C3_9RICK|nr:zinc protease [Candidatus Xenohaliotis californiensis]
MFGQSAVAIDDKLNIEPSVFTANNGMTVCVLKNTRVPLVSHVLFYKVGSFNEPVGLSGMAHLLEHMMFKATKERDSNYYVEQLEKIGARYNAATSAEYTVYYATFPKEYLALVMQLESHRMNSLLINNDELAKEKNVVMEERRQRVENNEFAKMMESMNVFLWLNYPYAHPTVGWEHDIYAISRDDLLNFYNKYYSPSNTILVLAGDVSVEDAKEMVDKYYPAKNSTNLATPNIKQLLPKLYGNTYTTIADSKIKQNKIIRSYRAPGIGSDLHNALIFRVLGEVISGKRNSQLYKYLVVERKVAVELDTEVDVIGNIGVFTFALMPSANVSMDVLSKELDSFLADLAKKGVSNEQVEIAKNSLKISNIYMHGSIDIMARYYAQIIALGLPNSFFANGYADYMEKISLDDVNNAIKSLVSGYFVEGWLKGDSAS